MTLKAYTITHVYHKSRQRLHPYWLNRSAELSLDAWRLNNSSEIKMKSPKGHAAVDTAKKWLTNSLFTQNRLHILCSFKISHINL